MKQGNLVVSGVLVAGVLLGAYGLGLLIRHARLGDREPQAQPVAEANDVATSETPGPGPKIGRAKPEPTPEELAAAKQQKAAALSKVENLTEQQRQERRDALRAQLRTRRPQPGGLPHLSPEELKDIREKWPQMSEEERQAYRAKMREVRPARRPAMASPADGNAPAAGAAEPNAADSN